MAHHKSALKRIRQSNKRRIYNRQFKKTIKMAIRSVREAEDFETAQQNLVKTFSVLDKAAAKGVLHKNNAANKKSKLTKFVRSLKNED
jgi:small subunit ribosomal protein S20